MAVMSSGVRLPARVSASAVGGEGRGRTPGTFVLAWGSFNAARTSAAVSCCPFFAGGGGGVEASSEA